MGFSLRRKRVTTNNEGEITRRTFECTHFGEHVSNQVIDLSRQRNRNSRKISCPWHINLSKKKSASVITITSVIGEHNHQMQPDIALYALKYRKLSPEILETIEFYVTKGNMGSKQILPLLTAKFPDHVIHNRDLYNAVQRFQIPLKQRHGDAQNVLNHLLQLKN